MRNPKNVYSWDDVPVVLDAPLVARIIGMNVETVQRKMKKGDIPAVKIGTDWRMTKSALMTMLGEGLAS